MCAGTARANRVPRELKNCKIAKGRIKSMTKGPLPAQKFEDKKTVYMLTASHSAETVSKTRHDQQRTLPKCIDTYNKNMGGVDQIDQMLEPYDATRKTVHWYVKLAIHLIQIAVLNGWTLYRK
ncbi:PiggyBac transposable element-derived protein 4 [Plakobranchus ocellatus]|uniref:PiggyBac transposable element-derived protein 4 n=1 Tax=Plakobranchus ocellatus TaxID=259542 RepID=A0AAV3Y7R3_9GAST|nr:PiggyBac transposable element-derived protein 4 [Plakobranchus ocellatus]